MVNSITTIFIKNSSFLEREQKKEWELMLYNRIKRNFIGYF
jgi:hypothetical protein